MSEELATAAFYTGNFVHLEVVLLENGIKIPKILLCEIRLH